MNPTTVLWVYIVLLVAGGLVGFLKAGSKASLIASVSFAAALILCAIGVIFQPHVADIILAGLLVLRLFVIYHDQQHHAILPRSRLAEVLMRVFGIFVLSPSSIWRSSHNYHHNHNSKLRGSHIGSFPIMTKAQCEPRSLELWLWW